MVTIGNYKIIRQIGEGGFGRTYEAEHILAPKIKACLKQSINITSEHAKILEREAELMAKIHHYSLPAFRDLIKDSDGSYILVMSFEEGRTLDKVIEKHKALHPEEVAWITHRLLGATYYLHSHGVIHGDIKPTNIIVQPKEHNAILIDYGLSSISPDRNTKSIGYTPVFAEPEIISGKPPLPESDLYSLGLTMLYALGGDPLTRSFPDHVPNKLQDFYNSFIRNNPLERTSWDKEDLVRKLSEVRREVFGREHTK